MKTIGIIVNPHAKKVRTGKISLDSLKAYVSENVRINIAGTPSELSDAICLYRDMKYDYIGIIGGDGTVHMTVSEIIKVYNHDEIPPVLILKGGTMDDVAHSVRIKGRGEQVLRRFIKKNNPSFDPEIVKRDTMKINGKYCFLFGTGAVPRVLNEAYSGSEKGFIKNINAVVKAIYQALTGFQEKGSIFEKLGADIFVDDNPLDLTETIGILSGTIEYIGLGFTPLSRSTETPGTFHSIITDAPPRFILKKILSLRWGRKIVHPLHYDDLYSRILIRADEPFQYTMDGDLYECDGTLMVEPGPEISFIRV